MASQKESIARCLEEVKEAQERLKKVAEPLLQEGELDRPAVGRMALECMAALVEVMSTLWDLEPDLVDPTFVPMTREGVVGAFARLRDAAGETLGRLVGDLGNQVPGEIGYRVAQARSDWERREILLEWWARAEPPYIDVEKLDKQLDEDRRWCRVVAARALGSVYGTELLDPATGDVDPAAVEAFRRGPPDEPA